MKKTLLLFTFLISVTLAAQHQQGSFYLDGATSAGYRQSVDDQANRRSVGASTRRFGYFFTDRILVGTQVSFSESEPDAFTNIKNRLLEFRPFARYYFPVRGLDKMHFFGEVGFGRFRPVGNGDAYETDFFFGAGAERQLVPGVLGTASLRYDAFASGLNFTNLDLGLNVLLGQLGDPGSAVALTAGTISADARLGSVRYGRMSSGGNTTTQTDIYLSPRAGYFVFDGLMVEADLDFLHTSGASRFDALTRGGITEVTSASVGINLRYYPLQFGRLLPFVTAGSSLDHSDATFLIGTREIDQTSTSIVYKAGLGASYFLSPNVALEGSVRYQNDDLIDSSVLDAATTRLVEDRKNVVAEVGLRFYLPSR